jgi:spore germination cell wall hydrolase CwlJ-like protein
MHKAVRIVLGTALALTVCTGAGPIGAGEMDPETASVQSDFDKAVAQPLSLEQRVSAVVADATAPDAETLCMAKVVHHEAANQPLEGQLAVAQLILNRMTSGTFPKTICGVVNQPGQFFHISRYRAPVKDPRWPTAIAIARIARDGVMDPVAPGALYYHATYVRPAWMMKRVRVARIGQHIFYR